MVITVEVYAEVRRMYLEGATQRQIAERLGIARNTVKKYIRGAETPWSRKEYDRKETVLTIPKGTEALFGEMPFPCTVRESDDDTAVLRIGKDYNDA